MSESSEDETVQALLEWVGAVQQEAPGAVMAVVWTHVDCCGSHGLCGGVGWQQVYVDVAAGDTGEHKTGIPVQYPLQLWTPSKLEGVDVIKVDRELGRPVIKVDRELGRPDKADALALGLSVGVDFYLR